jgi:hypothetical protein
MDELEPTPRGLQADPAGFQFDPAVSQISVGGFLPPYAASR